MHPQTIVDRNSSRIGQPADRIAIGFVPRERWVYALPFASSQPSTIAVDVFGLDDPDGNLVSPGLWIARMVTAGR